MSHYNFSNMPFNEISNPKYRNSLRGKKNTQNLKYEHLPRGTSTSIILLHVRPSISVMLKATAIFTLLQ